MNMSEEKVIMYDSPEAAIYRTDIKGWVSANGLFYGDGESGERAARYDGATHRKCEECTVVIKNRSYTVCDSCLRKRRQIKYNNMPFKEWDGGTPLVLFDDDKYFFDEESILDYAEDCEMKPEGLMLVICEPNHYGFISDDYWEDVLPEDGEVDDALRKKVDELNEFIKTLPPASWSAGKFRTSYKP